MAKDKVIAEVSEEQKEVNAEAAAKVQKGNKFGPLDTVVVKGEKCDFLKAGKEYTVGGTAAAHLIAKGSAKYVSHDKYKNPNEK